MILEDKLQVQFASRYKRESRLGVNPGHRRVAKAGVLPHKDPTFI